MYSDPLSLCTHEKENLFYYAHFEGVHCSCYVSLAKWKCSRLSCPFLGMCYDGIYLSCNQITRLVFLGICVSWVRFPRGFHYYS